MNVIFKFKDGSKFELTTNHPESNYEFGVVILDGHSEALKPNDEWPNQNEGLNFMFGRKHLVGDYVASFAKDLKNKELELVKKYLSQDPEKKWEV